MFHVCFTWLGIILPSPHCFHRCNQFSKRSTQICHCFPILFPLFIVYPKFQNEDCIAYKIWAKTELLHITCVSSPHIETANFPLLFHYAIMVPHRSLNFTWHHFTLSLFFPPFFPRVSIFQAFYSNFPLLSHFFPLFYIIVSHFFHCFSHHFPLLSHCFPIVLCHIPSFFHCFSHHFPSFSPPFPFFSHCFISYSLIFSMVFLIIFPSIAISPSPPRRADQGGIDTPPSPNCHLVHKPKKLYLWPPFLPPNFPIFGQLGPLCPQTPLTHFVRKKNFA